MRHKAAGGTSEVAIAAVATCRIAPRHAREDMGWPHAPRRTPGTPHRKQDAARAVTKQSGDEGIDGVIKEDRLGLDVIYVQAKRWDGTVGRPEIQKFAGALQGKRANKGVFITTSSFSKEAIGFANSIDSKIILIDGDKLAQLMIEFNVGASTTGQYLIKQIDSDYFDQ